MTRVRTFIPHDVVFPGEPSTFEAFRDLLRTLSRTDTLMWCARFNHTLENRGHHDEHFIQNRAARRFLGDVHLERINAWARRERRSLAGTRMFSRVQLVELTCWVALVCEDHPDDGNTFELESTRVGFTRAALLATEAWSASVYDERFGSSGDPISDRVRAAAVLRRAMAISSSRVSLLEAVARGASIFDDAMRSRRPELERLFSEASGLTFDEYLAIASALAMIYSADAADVLESNSALFDAARIGEHLCPAARSNVPAFLDLIAQTPEELAAALHRDDPDGSLRWGVKRSYRAVRDRPLLRVSRGRVIVLDPGMMCDAISMGPLFAALRVAPKGLANTLFGAFGNGVEAYVQRLALGMYPATPSLAPRVVLNPTSPTRRKGEAEELCDLVIHGTDGIALVETKGVFIRDEDVLSADPATFPNAIRKQYANPPSKGGRAKGAHQLVRAIERLARGDAQLVGLRAGMTIYPVLVTLDDLVSAPGTRDILHAAFAKALGADAGRFPFRLRGIYVAQLIVMTVGDVELLDRVVQTTGLIDVLRAYAKAGPAHSFHDHLAANQIAYGVAIHGRQVTEIADAAMDRAKEFLFGSTRADG